MDKIWLCQKHARPLEVYCTRCKSQICPECISTHESPACPEPDFDHVFKHAAEASVPKLDGLIKEAASLGPEHDVESTDLLTSLYNIITPLKRLVDEHTDYMEKLKAGFKQIESYAKSVQKAKKTSAEAELQQCKKRLQAAVSSQNISETIRVLKKIDAERGKQVDKGADKALVMNVAGKLKDEKPVEDLRKLAEEVQKVLFKCQRLRLNFSVFNWRCDRKYLSPKLALSEDGLEITCIQGTNYACIIGDTPIDYGIMVFEVTSSGLCCSGKEGFGVIEYDTFRDIYAANPNLPSAYDHMIGLMQGDVAKGMVILTGNELLLDVPFTVSINMCDHVLNVKGPGTLLTAELKSGVRYVPCFSLGCTRNKFTIRPLEALFDESDM